MDNHRRVVGLNSALAEKRIDQGCLTVVYVRDNSNISDIFVVLYHNPKRKYSKNARLFNTIC